MRKIFTYLLIFFYFIMLLKPVMPSVIDIMAHTFWYSHHMATVHFENGKYHVHYQYIEESKKNFPGNNNHVVKNENAPNDYLVYTEQYDFSIININEKNFIATSHILPSENLCKDYPPPKI